MILEDNDGAENRGESQSILLVDDNATVRQALGMILELEDGLHVAGEARTAEEAMKLIKSIQPTVAIIDISLNKSDGVALLREAKALAPEMKAIIFSLHDESLYIDAARDAGADAYIMKSEEPRVIIQTIRTTLAGKQRFPAPATS